MVFGFQSALPQINNLFPRETSHEHSIKDITISKWAISTQSLPSSRWSSVFFWWAVVERSERSSFCSGAWEVPAGENGGPCGCWWFPLRSAERAGQCLHVGGEHCRTVRADWEGLNLKHHRLGITFVLFPTLFLYYLESSSLHSSFCPPFFFTVSLISICQSFLTAVLLSFSKSIKKRKYFLLNTWSFFKFYFSFHLFILNVCLLLCYLKLYNASVSKCCGGLQLCKVCCCTWSHQKMLIHVRQHKLSGNHKSSDWWAQAGLWVYCCTFLELEELVVDGEVDIEQIKDCILLTSWQLK